MRNVTRGPIPKSLAQKASIWTQDLLDEIARTTITGEAVKSTFYDKYNKPDVKNALSLMYNRRCCFCEAPVTVVTKGEIEHRKPKRGPAAFPEETYSWNNLHLVCPQCNQAKGDKWDIKYEILDAVTDVPMERHLSYRYDEDAGGVLREAKTRRGRTTIRHAALNRDDLVEARVKIVIATLRIINEIDELGDSPKADSKETALLAKSRGDYGTLIEWVARKRGLGKTDSK